jgi:hypothetical protein
MKELAVQPTAAEIHMRHRLDEATGLLVVERQIEFAGAVRDHENNFISIDGPCPLTLNPEQTKVEAEIKSQNGIDLEGYTDGDRACLYKPRTKPKDWHGVYESDREAGYEIVEDLAATYGNVVMEIGSLEQMELVAKIVTAIWNGGRNVYNEELIRELAKRYPHITMLVKNGLDGDIGPAVRNVNKINEIRGDEGAPAALVYRGGLNAQTPEASQEAYKRAHEATAGRIFYDTAHGTEMAYDPQGKFQKSVAGQVMSSQALIHLTQQGFAPLGKISEASDIEAVMDPHMPLAMAMSDSRSVHAAKLGNRVSAADLIEAPYGDGASRVLARNTTNKPGSRHTTFVRTHYDA